MEQRTHPVVSPELCGRPSALEPGRAVVEFEALESMRADASGLVHGGFVFGLADYAAMLAVNHPHVVEVEVTRGGQSVFSGTFVCFTPSRHVLEPRP